MEAFAYCAPVSVAETLTLLEAHAKAGRRAQFLAGGTDLLVQLRTTDTEARALIDLKAIPETNRLSMDGDTTYIGAAIASAILNENEALKSRFPGLLESADLIGSTQIQGRASIGGNLSNASPAGDSIPALVANDAVCVIATTQGERRMKVEDFVVGVGKNALAGGEFLLGLEISNPASGTADAYQRFIPRTEMDIAVAGCGVRLSLDTKGVCVAARVAIGAVAPTVLLVSAAAEALLGSKLEDAALQAAGAACSEAATPIDDKRGTAEYRRKIVAVLCRRTAVVAQQRALIQ